MARAKDGSRTASSISHVEQTITLDDRGLLVVLVVILFVFEVVGRLYSLGVRSGRGS